MEDKIIFKILKSIKNVVGPGSHQLHEPTFSNEETKILNKTIKSKFVSSAGKYVADFENKFKRYVKSNNAIAVVNGTQAIFISLKICGVTKNDEILVPALTFVGTVNAINYTGATPHFIDSEINSFGVDSKKLENYLNRISFIKNGKCINRKTKKRIKAILPVHIFGHACDIENILRIAKKFNLKVIEDAAEALGSFYKNKHLGTFGDIGCFSFNGNKIITTGGGGMIVLKNRNIAKKIKHLTTTAKLKHKWEYDHDEVGYNFRMPNINAALGLAQLKKINFFLKAKRKLYQIYLKNFSNIDGVKLLKEPLKSKSNYWLHTIVLDKNKMKKKNKILKLLHKNKIFCRPVWKLISDLKPYKNCPKMNLSGSKEIYKRSINMPSSSHLA